MRLWSLHPGYLDRRGLVALWREGLLAQAVLAGNTRGYRSHPQLIRFRKSAAPDCAIAAYLQAVYAEACRRGYHFDEGKLTCPGPAPALYVTEGQLAHEWAHLRRKLAQRAPECLEQFAGVNRPQPHALFRVQSGGVAEWEARPRRAPDSPRTNPRSEHD